MRWTFSATQQLGGLTTAQFVERASIKAFTYATRCILSGINGVASVSVSISAVHVATSSSGPAVARLLASSSFLNVTYNVTFATRPFHPDITGVYQRLVSQLQRNVSNGQFGLLLVYFSDLFHGNLSAVTALTTPLAEPQGPLRSTTVAPSPDSNSHIVAPTPLSAPVLAAIVIGSAAVVAVLILGLCLRRRVRGEFSKTVNDMEKWIGGNAGNIRLRNPRPAVNESLGGMNSVYPVDEAATDPSNNSAAVLAEFSANARRFRETASSVRWHASVDDGSLPSARALFGAQDAEGNQTVYAVSQSAPFLHAVGNRSVSFRHTAPPATATVSANESVAVPVQEQGHDAYMHTLALRREITRRQLRSSKLSLSTDDSGIDEQGIL